MNFKLGRMKTDIITSAKCILQEICTKCDTVPLVTLIAARP